MTKPRSSKAKKARVISSRVSYRGPVFSVTTDQVEEPGGIRARRDVVRHSGSIVVLAVEGRAADPRVLLERQYRHAAGQMMWELPAGRIDAGERELAAAKRELLEETGFTALRWKKILHFYVSPGFLDETMSIYLAQDLRPGIAQPEEDEKIVTRFFPLSDALRMVLKGVIRDAKTIAGILWLAQQEEKGLLKTCLTSTPKPRNMRKTCVFVGRILDSATRQSHNACIFCGPRNSSTVPRAPAK